MRQQTRRPVDARRSIDDVSPDAVEAERRRELHRVLGDTTRDTLMAVLSASAQPRTAADLAEELGLHPNTVRPHLDRLRSVGLVRREIVRHGEVGRPQHHYSALVPGDDTDEGLDRDALALLAGAMVTIAREAGVTPDAARDGGMATAAALVAAADADRSATVGQLSDDLERLGFEPVVRGDAGCGEVEIVFGRCPFGALATDAPDIVCSIHEGLLDGFAQGDGAPEILDFVGPSPDADCKVLVKVDDTHKMNPSPIARANTRSTQ